MPWTAIASKGFLSKEIMEHKSCAFHHPLTCSVASMFKSAGQNFLNKTELWGKPSAAQLLVPASNHTSRISGTRFISPLHFLHFIFTFSSMKGLCSSRFFSFFPDAFSSSFKEPITICSLHFSHCQI